MRRALTVAVVLAGLAMPALAQDETLADIRQQLTVVNVELQRLKRELSTSGGAQVPASGGSVLERVNTIESELTRLTAKTEELEFRIGQVIANGELQIGDLNFRLCEVEPGCDIGSLPELRLGSDAQAPIVTPQVAPNSGGTQLASNEQADFERASEALAQGDFRSAADQFATFNATYPGGPLAIAADIARGDALDQMGDTREAARAYLEAFRLDQDGPLAPDALFRLGRALAALGQGNEACVTLGEVNARFPGGEAALSARAEMQRIGCT